MISRSRTIREDAVALAMATKTIRLGAGQFFCELPKSWELWGYIGSLPYRVKRWPKRGILFVFTKEERDEKK